MQDRPWGWYRVLGQMPSAVKVLSVKPGSRLSLQSHKHRMEVWFPLTDGLVAEIDGERKALKQYQQVVINNEKLHRLSNPTDVELQVVELIYGLYDESDIIRYEDDYGRD